MFYQPPTQPAKQSETKIPPVVRVRIAKRNPTAQYIHNDGSRIYKWQNDKMYYANWDFDDYGSWWLWQDEQIPTGELVEL